MSTPEQPREQLTFPNSRRACEDLLISARKVNGYGFQREDMDQWNQDFLQKFGDDQIHEAQDDLKDQIGRIQSWTEDFLFQDRIDMWKNYKIDSTLSSRLGDNMEELPEADRADAKMTIDRMRQVVELLLLIRYYDKIKTEAAERKLERQASAMKEVTEEGDQEAEKAGEEADTLIEEELK